MFRLTTTKLTLLDSLLQEVCTRWRLQRVARSEFARAECPPLHPVTVRFLEG